MNGKIALCFYGLLRNNNQVSNLWKQNIIEPLNADIFCCTSDLIYGKRYPLNGENEIKLDYNYLLDTYGNNLKKHIIYNYDISKYKKYITDHNLPIFSFQEELTWRTLSMFHHIKGVINLKRQYESKNNIKYDITILARPDLEINNIPNIENLSKDIVYYSGDHSAAIFYFGDMSEIISNIKGQSRGVLMEDFINCNYIVKHSQISDHLLISKSENIDLLASIYDNILEYHKSGIILSNETLIGYTFIKNKINVEYNSFLDHKVYKQL